MTSIPIRLAEAQAPRYTSYPTAPHFDEKVDGEVYRGWLAALPGAPCASSPPASTPISAPRGDLAGCYSKAV